MKGIILFDGVCNFCDASVQFIMKHDSQQFFQFASLQSEAGQELVERYNLQQIDSVIVIKNEKAYVKSAAAIEIVKHFNGLWKIFIVSKVIPPKVRDRIYEYIAKNRYKWFGKKEVCRIPTQEERSRFL